MSFPESDKDQSLEDFLQDVSALLDPSYAEKIAELKRAEEELVSSLAPAERRQLVSICVEYARQYFNGMAINPNNDRHIDKAANQVVETFSTWQKIMITNNPEQEKLLRIVSPGVIGLVSGELQEGHQKNRMNSMPGTAKHRDADTQMNNWRVMSIIMNRAVEIDIRKKNLRQS